MLINPYHWFAWFLISVVFVFKLLPLPEALRSPSCCIFAAGSRFETRKHLVHHSWRRKRSEESWPHGKQLNCLAGGADACKTLKQHQSQLCKGALITLEQIKSQEDAMCDIMFQLYCATIHWFTLHGADWPRHFLSFYNDVLHNKIYLFLRFTMFVKFSFASTGRSRMTSLSARMLDVFFAALEGPRSQQYRKRRKAEGGFGHTWWVWWIFVNGISFNWLVGTPKPALKK